jgi:hypothetical protein
MSELKVSDYNTHDCHTILSLFLAIAIGAVNHPYLKMVIRRMCHFFNDISNKIIDVVELDEIHKEMQMTMCQLEMCLPPSFFDMMEHYMLHLADQVFVLGPMYMHHMYLYECHMVVMKGYLHNRAHPEGFMIEGYTTEEVIECCEITSKMENQYMFLFQDTMVDSMGKEPNDINHSLMLLTKESVRHIFASCTS